MIKLSDYSLGIKLALICVMTPLLLIPVALVGRTREERGSTAAAAMTEVAEKWGGTQTLSGPMVRVPYTVRTRGEKDRIALSTNHFWVLPRNLSYTVKLEPQVRWRGIYRVNLYVLRAEMTGDFVMPDPVARGLLPANGTARDVRWNEAVVMVPCPDMKSIDSQSLTLDDREVVMEGDNALTGTLSGSLNMKPILGTGTRHVFTAALVLRGSSGVYFLPLGAETSARIESAWPSPRFAGNILPVANRLDATSFTAEWRSLAFNRPIGPIWNKDMPESVQASRFGVDLITPVDVYLMTERALKYSIVIIILPFAMFFLFEVFMRLKIHPLQYLLVGFVVCIFYLLLLSISEHVAFAIAYCLASAAVVALIGVYAAAMLKSVANGLGVGGLFVVMYGFLYVVLQSEDFALVIGASGLFLILAAFMVFTRKVDWYAVGKKREP